AAMLAPVAPSASGGSRSQLGPGSATGNGFLAFVSNAGGDRDVYRMSSDASLQVDLTNTPGSDIDPAWSPSGTKLAFTTDRNGNREVYVMNPDGSGQANLTNNAAPDFGPVFSPDDGTRIAFTSDRTGIRNIFVINYYALTNLTYGLI